MAWRSSRYDREWRANPVISGGARELTRELHLVDLSRWFLAISHRFQGVPNFLLGYAVGG
jgi:hypothetical protein